METTGEITETSHTIIQDLEPTQGLAQQEEKAFYRIDEVCTISGIKPYVLRFWESEFPEITPTLTTNGQKHYTPSDLEIIALIKKFLFEEKMSIEKARMKILTFSRQRDQVFEDASLEVMEVVPEKVIVEEISPPGLVLTPEHQEHLFSTRIKLQELLLSVELVKKRFHWS